MPRRASGPHLVVGHLLERTGTPVHRELESRLRRLITEGLLSPGLRLPSTRTLAREAGVSRNTVLAAYDRLTAAGLLESRPGSGTFVAPRHPPGPGAPGAHRPAPPPWEARIPVRPFQTGLVSPADFPFRAWASAAAEALRVLRTSGRPDRLDPALEEARSAVSEHLAAVRQVRSAPHQILFTTGFRHSMSLVVRALVRPGDAVLVEDPGAIRTRHSLQEQGARVLPLPVDALGALPPSGPDAEEARLAFVSPARQFPTGVALAPERASALLTWARSGPRWIVEDDHDSEFVERSRPAPSLHGRETEAPVIHVGGFSRLLHPVARVGYVVVPDSLAEAFAAALHDDDERVLDGDRPSRHTLATLASFLGRGHLDLYVRRLRSRFEERSHALRWAVEEELGPALPLLPGGSSQHLVGLLPEGTDDQELCGVLARAGLTVRALGPHYLAHPRPGLILGSAAFDPPALRAAVRTLSRAWRERR